ncbi:DUF4177 domain-containing protein [Kribbella hippodromi]|uniref:DUF4177 domain-containing protein n=2 Tax=Kribbella hippodromi TaxID=434347 RepID=A0ABN2DXW4_9ACTN
MGEESVQSPVMKKFEYFTAPLLVHSTKEILDNFGQDGWELVQIVPGMNPENLVAYFKREIEDK